MAGCGDGAHAHGLLYNHHASIVFLSQALPFAMASSTTVMQWPHRFYLLADNNKFVARSEKSENPSYNKYYAHCRGDVSADDALVVFEAGSSHPQSKSAVTWKHVESGDEVIQTALLWILPGELPWKTCFRLDAVDLQNSKAAIYVTLDDPDGVGSSVPQNAYLVRQDRDDGGGKILPDALCATGKSVGEATIFRVYDSALKKVWQEVVFDFANAKMEDVEVFESGSDVLDNSEFDQTVTFHPSVTYSQSIESNWSSSSSFGFQESISVTSKVPFVEEVEVGFTAEQSFETSEGGSSAISTERAVELDVPVPPFTKVQVFVVGTQGKVSIPFQHKEIATYNDGTTRERILDDGVCKSVSSTGTTWKVKYLDDGKELLSGKLPRLL